MDKEKYVGTNKRKTIDDSLDDSFDFFLPNKLKEKSVMKQMYIKSGNNSDNSNRRKKMSPTSTSSSSFSQETFDTDMENVMAVCLSKNDYTFSKLSNVRNKENVGNCWKEITSKMKRQPLLMTRTTAEREAILSQKLAVILVDNNAKDDNFIEKNYSVISLNFLIHSELLLQQWCQKCRLWKAAQQPPLNNREFCTKSFTNYIEFDETTEKDSYDNDEATNFMFGLEKYEDLVTSKDIEDRKLSSPSDKYTSDIQIPQHIIDNEKSALDMFENYKSQDTTDNVRVNKTEICV